MTQPIDLTVDIKERYLSAIEDYVALSGQKDKANVPNSPAEVCTYAAVITDLPVEVLGEIFLLAAPPTTDSPWWHWEHAFLRFPPAPDHPESPLKFGHISRYLRFAAWSTPALWTYIDIYPTLVATYLAAVHRPGCRVRMHTNVTHQAIWLNDQFWATDEREDSRGALLGFPTCLAPTSLYPPVHPNTTGARLLQEWLDRSGELPLTIVCRREHAWPSLVRWNRFTIPLFRVLAGAAHRWARVDMFVPDNCARLLAAACDTPFGALHTASLCAVVSNGWTARAQVDAAFLRAAPQLRRLQVCGFYHFGGITGGTYSSLTELWVSDTRASSLVRLLGQTPQLRTLVARDVHDTAGMRDVASVEIELQWLASLTLLACTSAILERLHLAPMLEEMKFVEMTDVQLDALAIARFLRRAGCALGTLELEAQRMHAPSLAHIVERAPLLTILKICLRSQGEGGEAVGEALGRLLSLDVGESERHTTCVPFLIHLELHASGGPFMGVIDAVKQRWQRGHLIEVRDVPRSLEVANIRLVAKVTFVGFIFESDELAAVTRRYMKAEIDEGLSVKFAKWKEVETMQDAISAYR